MKNWMLVCCVERDIEEPRFYETYEEAYEQMRSEFAEFMGWNLDEVDDLMADSGSNVGLASMGAWGERFGNNCDWKIFNIEGRI